MICFMCGRRLTKAAAIVPATSGRDPHPEGAVGPTCARKAGLLPPRPALLATRRRRGRAPKDSPQADWVGTAS